MKQPCFLMASELSEPFANTPLWPLTLYLPPQTSVQASPPVGRSVIRGQGYLCGAFMFLSQGKCMVGALRWWGKEWMNETSVLSFWSYPQCMWRLNHLWASSQWQVINHCPQAPFPGAACEQCPLKILEFPPWAAAISRGGFGGLSLPFPLTQPLNGNVSEAFLHIPSGCCLHPFPFHFASCKSPGWGISQDLTYTPSKETSFMLGEGLRLWRAGAFKKIPFPFPCWCGA